MKDIGSGSGDQVGIRCEDGRESDRSGEEFCPIGITEHPPLGEARLLAAYKVCPSCHANLDEYLFMEHGDEAAYLYEDGLLLYRVGPKPFVPGFSQRMVTQEEACALFDGVDLAGLTDEAAKPGSIMYRESVDAEATLVYLRYQGIQLEVDLNGSIHSDFGLTPESAARAANSAALAQNLSALAKSGSLYQASGLALWATTGEPVEMVCPSDPELPDWPFEDVPLLDMSEMEFKARTNPMILQGETAQEVRDWAQAQEEVSPCWRLAVRHDDQDWLVILIDLPPEGYDAHPVSPCWTTGC